MNIGNIIRTIFGKDESYAERTVTTRAERAQKVDRFISGALEKAGSKEQQPREKVPVKR